MTLSWINPTDTDFTGVMIRRAVGPIAPHSPSTGALVIDTDSQATEFTDTGLDPNTQYSYALFAHDAASNFGAQVAVTVETSTTCPARVNVSGRISTDTTWMRSDCGTVIVVVGVVEVAEGVT